jgi:transcriptional regulator with XRE-family HTH domain
LSYSFAHLIRQHREAAGWSQLSMARGAGLSTPTVANLEQGRTPDPRASTVAKLARALDVPVSDLLQPFVNQSDS